MFKVVYKIKNVPGKKYLAAYLLRNDVAGIETGPLEFQEDRILQFYTYEATQNIHTKVCFDHDLKCPFIVGGDVQLNDRQWKLSSIRVPKETKKVCIFKLLLCLTSRDSRNLIPSDILHITKQRLERRGCWNY